MYGYKCDKCGAPAYVDPGEPRLCDRCQEAAQKQDTARIVYDPGWREVRHAG